MAALIEVTGVVINPELHRWDDTVVVEVDCNGPLKESNKLLWDAVSRIQGGTGSESGSTREGDAGDLGQCVASSSPSLVDGGAAYGRPGRSESTDDIGGLFTAGRRASGTRADFIKFKGVAEDGELRTQRTYRFYGEVSAYKNKRTGQTEAQFSFRTFVRVKGHGQAGTIRYLCDCPHVGSATANALWAKFEGEAVRILRESPDVAVAAVNLPHFTEIKAQEAAEHLRSQLAMEANSIELIDVLGSRGFPKTTAQAVTREYGNRAAEIIRRDPYKLMQFRGCGFLKCNKMYLSLGGDPSALKRQALAAWYVLASNSEHTWMAADLVAKGMARLVAKGMARLVGGADINPMRALRLAKRAGLIAVKQHVDQNTGIASTWLAEGKRARQEQYVADRLVQLLNDTPAWPDFPSLVEQALEGVTEFRPTQHQLDAVKRATRKSVGILRGGPGTGKSFTTACMVKALELLHGSGQIAVVAPTGKAAARLKQALNEYGCRTEATTIHGLLKVASGGSDPAKRDSGGWSFRHNADNPLPHKFVFLDEGSMPPTSLMASFLAACGTGTNLLIIGDTNQLPPIEHGAPMRDMLAAGVPHGELTEPQRNSGTIVLACCDIRDGKKFRFDKPDDIDIDAVPPKNFTIIESATPQQQIDALLSEMEWTRSKGLDPVWDVQCVVAVNDKSPLSRKVINPILQGALNPAGFTIPGNIFRTNDKVICTENGEYRCVDPNSTYANERGVCFVANGEFGKVLHVEEKLVHVRFFHPTRDIAFSKMPPKKDKLDSGKRGTPSTGEDGDTSDTDEIDGTERKASETGCNLDLAYACTCHKLQGSEAKFVIPLLDSYAGARRICMREWFFTSLSRGKRVTKMIGKESLAESMVRSAALPSRKTFLKELLLESLWGDL